MMVTGTGIRQLNIIDTRLSSAPGLFQVPSKGSDIIFVMRHQPAKVAKTLHVTQSDGFINCEPTSHTVYIQQSLLDTPLLISLAFACAPMFQSPSECPNHVHHNPHATRTPEEFTVCVSLRAIYYSSLSPFNTSNVIRIPAQHCTLILSVGNNQY